MRSAGAGSRRRGRGSTGAADRSGHGGRLSAVKGHPEASSARVTREVATGGLRLALSDAFLSEVTRVMKDPEVDRGIGSAGRAFEIALDLGVMGVLYRPRRYDWPSLRDPDDWWLLDLAFESGADFIVTWDPDLLDYARDRGEPHGFDVLTPPRLLQKLER